MGGGGCVALGELGRGGGGSKVEGGGGGGWWWMWGMGHAVRW